MEMMIREFKRLVNQNQYEEGRHIVSLIGPEPDASNNDVSYCIGVGSSSTLLYDHIASLKLLE